MLFDRHPTYRHPTIRDGQGILNVDKHLCLGSGHVWRQVERIEGQLYFTSQFGNIMCRAALLEVQKQYRPTKNHRSAHTYHQEELFEAEFSIVTQPRGDRIALKTAGIPEEMRPPGTLAEYWVLCNSCGFEASVCFLGEKSRDQINDEEYMPKFCSACGSKDFYQNGLVYRDEGEDEDG